MHRIMYLKTKVIGTCAIICHEGTPFPASNVIYLPPYRWNWCPRDDLLQTHMWLCLCNYLTLWYAMIETHVIIC